MKGSYGGVDTGSQSCDSSPRSVEECIVPHHLRSTTPNDPYHLHSTIPSDPYHLDSTIPNDHLVNNVYLNEAGAANEFSSPSKMTLVNSTGDFVMQYRNGMDSVITSSFSLNSSQSHHENGFHFPSIDGKCIGNKCPIFCNKTNNYPGAEFCHGAVSQCLPSLDDEMPSLEVNNEDDKSFFDDNGVHLSLGDPMDIDQTDTVPVLHLDQPSMSHQLQDTFEDSVPLNNYKLQELDTNTDTILMESVERTPAVNNGMSSSEVISNLESDDLRQNGTPLRHLKRQTPPSSATNSLTRRSKLVTPYNFIV